MSQIGDYAVPILILIILCVAVIKKEKPFDLFLDGAAEGLDIFVKIIPTLIGLITSVEMLRASGVLEVASNFTATLTGIIGMPSEILPLALLRPISGGGAIAIFDDILKSCGPDSLAGRTASVLCGSSETTFYTTSLYYGSCGITKTGHTLFAALCADAAAVVFSTLAVRLLF